MTEAAGKWLICARNQLPHAQCLEFSIPADRLLSPAAETDGFVVNWHGNYIAYQNSCPHTGASLNWMPNQFFDHESRYIQCGMHGAIFEPDTGLCIRGPCLAQSLLQLPLITQSDNLYILFDEFTHQS